MVRGVRSGRRARPRGSGPRARYNDPARPAIPPARCHRPQPVRAEKRTDVASVTPCPALTGSRARDRLDVGDVGVSGRAGYPDIGDPESITPRPATSGAQAPPPATPGAARLSPAGARQPRPRTPGATSGGARHQGVVGSAWGAPCWRGMVGVAGQGISGLGWKVMPAVDQRGPCPARRDRPSVPTGDDRLDIAEMAVSPHKGCPHISDLVSIKARLQPTAGTQAPPGQQKPDKSRSVCRPGPRCRAGPGPTPTPAQRRPRPRRRPGAGPTPTPTQPRPRPNAGPTPTRRQPTGLGHAWRADDVRNIGDVAASQPAKAATSPKVLSR